MTSEIVIGVWEPFSGATWAKVHEIRTWASVSVEPRHLDPGIWSLAMPYDRQAVSLTKEHLFTFDLRRDTTTRLMTGVPTVLGPAGAETGGVTLEASGMGALGLLGDVLCWPNPSQALDSQTAMYYTATGATETVLRGLIVGNWVTRRGDDLVIPATSGRGKTITVKEAFSNLLVVVATRCRQAGLAARMGLEETTSSTRAQMKLQFYVPTDKSQRVRLSHKVGSLRTWKQSDTAPTGTRALVAGKVLQTPLKVEYVNITADTITTTTNTHTLKTGAVIKLDGNLPDPLTSSTTYYAIRVDADSIQVAESLTKALAGTAVNLTEAGLNVESVNTTTDAITISSGDMPKTGSRLRFTATGTPPPPLDAATTYYAIRIDKDTLKVASSLANATAGTPINLTGAGSGDLHFFVAGSVSLVEVARTYRQVVESAIETEWGRKIETFVDARSDEADDETELLERGSEALADMGAQSGFELEAVEAEGIRFGEHFDLGDTVAIELMTGLETTDVLGAVQVEAGSGGLTVKLVPGNPDSGKPLFQQAAIVRQLRRDIRALQREEG